MEVLPTTSSDADILRHVDAWVSKLESEDYAGALQMVDRHPSWTAGVLRGVIKAYGSGRSTQIVTLEAKRTDVAQRKSVERWSDAPNGTLGEVWYDLGIDGMTSDLTATFYLVQKKDGLALRLIDVHVM